MKRAGTITGWIAMALIASSAQACGKAPVTFKCEVSGEKMLSAPLTAADVCAQFKTELVKQMPSGFTDTAIEGGDWIMVDVAFQKNGIINAAMTGSIAGKQMSWPQASMAVSDSAVTSSHVATLAQSAASAMNREK
jgi:hypothetical protein